MKNLTRYTVVLLLLIGCNRVEKKKTGAAPAGDAVLSSADSKIPPHELKHYLEEVKFFVDSTLQNHSMNGSILVAKNGQVIYEQYQGFRNPRLQQDSITPHTSFHLASISKTFTGMAVLKLWELGKLNIDDSVTQYLPGFPCKDVTIRTLLNHRSGIPKYDHYMENLGWDKRKMVTNQDVLDFLIARYKDIPIRKADRGFSYSNTNFALLALIIEKVSGLPYKDFMKQTFFDPLGMKDTYVFTISDTSHYLPSYYHNGRPYRFDYLDLVYGDKNIYSTVRDLLKWHEALEKDSLFKPETLAFAYKGYSFEKPGTHNYGLGWRMYLLKNGKKIIYHNGWWHGNRTSFYRLLDEDVTIIALCNNDYRQIYNVKNMCDIFGDYFQTRDHDDDEESEAVTHITSPKSKKLPGTTAVNKKSPGELSVAGKK